MSSKKSKVSYVKITEGKVSKGGVNAKPSTPRPTTNIGGQGQTTGKSKSVKTTNTKNRK